MSNDNYTFVYFVLILRIDNLITLDWTHIGKQCFTITNYTSPIHTLWYILIRLTSAYMNVIRNSFNTSSTFTPMSILCNSLKLEQEVELLVYPFWMNNVTLVWYCYYLFTLMYYSWFVYCLFMICYQINNILFKFFI